MTNTKTPPYNTKQTNRYIMGFSKLFSMPSMPSYSSPTTVETPIPVVSYSESSDTASAYQQQRSNKKGLLSTLLSKKEKQQAAAETGAASNSATSNNTTLG